MNLKNISMKIQNVSGDTMKPIVSMILDFQNMNEDTIYWKKALVDALNNEDCIRHKSMKKVREIVDSNPMDDWGTELVNSALKGKIYSFKFLWIGSLSESFFDKYSFLRMQNEAPDEYIREILIYIDNTENEKDFINSLIEDKNKMLARASSEILNIADEEFNEEETNQKLIDIFKKECRNTYAQGN